MWPVLLDMTKEESMQSLRNLELEAYAHLVSALRAQGPLNPDKRKLLKDSSQVLNIPQDRHKAEIRRAVNDEKLNTIAYHVTGLTESLEDWAQEGRRSVPLIPRMAPQTAYSAIADEAAEAATQNNKQLPPPAATERKRPLSQPSLPLPESSKGVSFRVPETPKADEKKRKLPIENSSLAQHLLGPPKISRTHQIYRQRPKVLKEQLKMKPQPRLLLNGPKLSGEEHVEQSEKSELLSSNENQAPRPKLLTSTKPSTSFAYKQITTTVPGPSNMKKPLAKPGTPLGQKLIVVSNAQTIQSSTILQKTLSIPLTKNISLKNFEKFKIVTTSSPQLVTASNNINSFKHKVVTVKTNPTTKKVIPLSLINSKGGIKVLPIGGKIVGKSTTTTSPPLYIVNTVTPKSIAPVQQTVTESPNLSKENGKSSVLGDILKASGVTTDDFDTQIEEFRIPNNHVVEGEAQEQIEGETAILHEEQGFESSECVQEEQLNTEVIAQDSDRVILEVQNTEMSVSDAGN